MTTTVRYPAVRATTRGPSEDDQIIELLHDSAGPLEVGGPATYINVSAWKTVGRSNEAPYTCLSIEFSSGAAQTIGAGTDPVCLFGVIGDLTTGKKLFLGTLGISLGATWPQIPILAGGGGSFVGYSQNLGPVSVFDGLMIGSMTAPIVLAANISVVVRPLRLREYIG